jgi:protein-S-isoprenylcysteine O-methyltransferase Ste14
MALIGKLLFAALLFCFVLFLLIVFKRRGPAEAAGNKSSRAVRLGVLLQTLSYSVAWTFRRLHLNPLGEKALGTEVLIAFFSLLLAFGAVVLAAAAKRHLGRQWALAARVVDGHHLVTDGPFGFIRHPIYVAMGLLLLAPVLGLSSWLGAAVSLLLFIVGTSLRARAEDQLLAKTFGREFQEYRRRVPAFFPRVGSRRRRPGDEKGL